MDAVLALLKVVLAELPGAVTTVVQLVDLGKKFYAVQTGRAPTEAEVEQLRASLAADVLKALEPLPPAQPGDPDYVA